MYTYKDLKIVVLEKLGEGDSIVNGDIVLSTNVSNYISLMPNLLREALQLCSTSGKYIVSYYDIVNNPVENLLDNNETRVITQVTDEDLEYEVEGAQSYYFEVCGKCTVEIYVNDVLTTTIVNTVETTFTPYKGNLPNVALDTVKIAFTALYPYQVKNTALYSCLFETALKVFDNTPYKRYDLKALIPTFFKLKNNDMPFEGGVDLIEYENNANYHWEGDKVLVLDNDKKGLWRVYYYAYPQTVESDIADADELVLDPEVYAILPLYIVGQILRAEDEDNATARLREFEQRKAELTFFNEQPSNSVEFRNDMGW